MRHFTKPLAATALLGFSIFGASAGLAEPPPLKPPPVPQFALPKSPPHVDLRAVPSTMLVLDAFTTGAATCTPTRHAKVVVNAVIRLTPAQATGTKFMLDMKVNGTSLGATAVTPYHFPNSTQSFVQLRREIELPALGGRATVQYSLGGASSAIKSFDYSCIQAVTPPQKAATQINRPDLAIASPPIVVVMYEPPKWHDPNDPCGGAGRTLGQCNVAGPDYPRRYGELDPSDSIVVRDFTTTVPVWRVTGAVCPREQDAYATVSFYVAFTIKGVATPSPMVESWLDFTNPPAPRAGFASWPQGAQGGYYWAWVDKIVPCSHRQSFELTLDAANVLAESDETNNTIRFDFATAP